MTSPNRVFSRSIRSTALALAFLALAAGMPARAQVEDDEFPALDASAPAAEDELPLEPTLPQEDQRPPAAEPPADPREEYIFHESGIPYIPARTSADEDSEAVEIAPETVEAYHRAEQLMEEGKNSEALEILQRITLPVNLPLYELRARALAGMGRTDLAISLLEQTMRSIRTNGQSTPWTLLETRGDIYFDAELFDQAISDYSAAADSVLENPYLLSKLGMARVRFGMSLRGTNPQASYEEMAQGIASLEEAVKLGLNDEEIQGHLGIAYSELRDVEGAIRSYLAAIDFNPEATIWHQLIGFSYLRQASQKAAADPENREAVIEDYHLSLAHFTQAIDLDPGDFDEEDSPEQDMDLDLGDAAMPGEEEVSTGYFEKLDPALIYSARANVHIALGNFLTDPAARAEQYNLAIANCDFAIKLFEGFDEAWMHRGVALRMLEEFEPAVDAFTEAIKSSRSPEEALLRRGIVWYYLGEYGLAIMDFEQVNQYSTDIRASFWKGLSEGTRGEYLQAVRDYTEVIRLAPDHNLARVNRGLAYLQLGEHERALEDFNQMIRQDQSNADAYYYRGRALEEMNNPEGAARSYQRALYWNPEQRAAAERLESLSLSGL